MMANAAKDPVWQAKVSSEVARFPALQAVIEKKCVTCHMPMAETQAVAEGQPVTALGDGFFNPANPLHPAAIDGVSCTLCHQIRDANFGEMASFSGGYTVDTSTNPPDRPIFGPYEQPVAEVMQASTGFDPVYGAHMASAEHCATCHNLYTPYVDAQGNILGEFPEQTPYTEWQIQQLRRGSHLVPELPHAAGPGRRGDLDRARQPGRRASRSTSTSSSAATRSCCRSWPTGAASWRSPPTRRTSTTTQARVDRPDRQALGDSDAEGAWNSRMASSAPSSRWPR